MSCHTVGIVLSSLGGAAELLGLFLVVVDVTAARRAARSILAAPDEAPGPPRSVASRVRLRWDVGGTVPPVDERVTLLAQQLGDVADRFEDRLDREVDELRGEIAREGTEAHKRARARDVALRDAIAEEVLNAGAGRRLAGVGFIALGVVLTLAGSIVLS